MIAVSALTHKPMAEIIDTMPDDIVKPVLTYPGMRELIDLDTIEDAGLNAAIQKRM